MDDPGTRTYAISSPEREALDNLWAKALLAKNPTEALLYLDDMHREMRRIERRIRERS